VSNRQAFARHWYAGRCRDHQRRANADSEIPADPEKRPGKHEPSSPAQMQDMYAAFNAWKEKFKANIVDMGGKLKPGGKVLTVSGVMDARRIVAPKRLSATIISRTKQPGLLLDETTRDTLRRGLVARPVTRTRLLGAPREKVIHSPRWARSLAGRRQDSRLGRPRTSAQLESRSDGRTQ
jgi:hypothetical protein